MSIDFSWKGARTNQNGRQKSSSNKKNHWRHWSSSMHPWPSFFSLWTLAKFVSFEDRVFHKEYLWIPKPLEEWVTSCCFKFLIKQRFKLTMVLESQGLFSNSNCQWKKMMLEQIGFVQQNIKTWKNRFSKKRFVHFHVANIWGVVMAKNQNRRCFKNQRHSLFVTLLVYDNSMTWSDHVLHVFMKDFSPTSLEKFTKHVAWLTESVSAMQVSSVQVSWVFWPSLCLNCFKKCHTCSEKSETTNLVPSKMNEWMNLHETFNQNLSTPYAEECLKIQFLPEGIYYPTNKASAIAPTVRMVTWKSN